MPAETGSRKPANSQELDKESGYYFYNARHYDPEIGRFVTPDTIVPRENDTQSWNRLSYCRNNPIVYKDPTGHAEREGLFGIADRIGAKIDSAGEGIKSFASKVDNAIRNSAPVKVLDKVANYANKNPQHMLAIGLGGGLAIAAAPFIPAAVAAGGNGLNTITTAAFVKADVALATSSTLSSIGGVAAKNWDKLKEIGRNIFGGSGSVNKADFYGTSAGEIIPATGYRALGGSGVNRAINGNIMSLDKNTYITFNNISNMTGKEVKDLLQMPNVPSHYAKFDTLQIIDDLKIPTGKWGQSKILEPICNTLPDFGKGDGTQAITSTPINNFKLFELKK